MRILIISDEQHLSDAVLAAQEVLKMDRGSSVTITDEQDATELIEFDGYDRILKNPSYQEILEAING